MLRIDINPNLETLEYGSHMFGEEQWLEQLKNSVFESTFHVEHF